jgi:uncharacterized protein
MNENDLIKEIFKNTKTIAIVGLSPKPHRASHHVASYLKSQGFKIIPVYPRENKILGEKVYGSLSEIQEKVDTVCIFRNPSEVVPVVQEAVKLKPFAIWMQETVINDEAANIARNAGINVIMDKCMYKEHCKL